MSALMARLADENATVRQKALMALSCLLRHNLDGLAAFVQVRARLRPGLHASHARAAHVGH